MFVVNKSSLAKAPLLLTIFILSGTLWSDCLPFDEARKHIGETKCITGKVVRVKARRARSSLSWISATISAYALLGRHLPQ